MKEFNLELAKAGHPVCTRDGKPARIISFDANMENFPIVAVVTFDGHEELELYTEKGKFFKTEQEDEFDLMMISEVKDGDDKRIKEAISYAIANSIHEDGILLNGVTESEAIAWLEKKGEQKTNEIHPIFRVGDYIRNKKTKDKVIIEQLDIATKAYCYVSYDGAAVNHSDFPFSQQNEWEIIGQKIVEKKTVEKVEPKFKVGDWIIHNKNIELTNSLMLVTGKDNNEYLCKDIDGQCSYNIEFIDKDYHLWTIEDAKDGDVLVASDGSIFLLKGVVGGACKHYVALTSDNVVKFNEGLEHNWETSIAVHPATKEQRDTLEKAMADVGYTFNFEKRKLKKIEQTTMVETCEIENIEHGKYYYCIKDYFCGGRKQASKGDVVQALRGMSMMALGVKANEYFLPVNSIKQNTAWSKEDERNLRAMMKIIKEKAFADYDVDEDNNMLGIYGILESWLKTLKDRVQPQNLTVTDEELAKAKKDAYNDALDKIEYYSGKPTFDDGWSAAICYLKKKNTQFNHNWKPSEEQMKLLREVQQALLGKDCHNRFVGFMYELKRLREE